MRQYVGTMEPISIIQVNFSKFVQFVNLYFLAEPKYDLHLAKKMIKHLIQLTLVKDVSGLKDLDVPIAVWNKLSKKFGIDNENLKRFWLGKLHMQLFCKDPIYLNDVKIKMIE